MTTPKSERQIEREIQGMIDRETAAWNDKDAKSLVDLFHPDMIWPWPATEESHDPLDWVFPWGRYDRERWQAGWQGLFDTHDLIHNRRTTRKITVSEQRDGAFAVVDIDTLWRDRDGRDFLWKGRTGKGYTLVGDEWKLVFHTGVLSYETSTP